VALVPAACLGFVSCPALDIEQAERGAFRRKCHSVVQQKPDASILARIDEAETLGFGVARVVKCAGILRHQDDSMVTQSLLGRLKMWCEDGIHTDLVVVEEPVCRFDGGFRSARLGNVGRRHRKEGFTQLHEPGNQALVAQYRRAELFLNPVGGFALRRLRPGGNCSVRQRTQYRLPVVAEGIKVNILGRGCRSLAASPGSSTHILPVGATIAGAGKTASLYKGLKQNRTIGVPLLPVVSESLATLSKNVGGQARHLDHGQNQKPAVVDYELQRMLAGLFAPTDELIPAADPPG